MTPANTSLPTGETEQFTATGTLSNNTTENLTSQVTWASSDTTWATINTAGLATAVSPGPVTISAAFDGITGSTGLTVVTPPTLQSIAVTPANTSLATGETEQFTATGTLSNNTTENLTSQVTWASSDTTWATINATGLATAVSPGPVTISAAFDGITGSTGLTVVPAPTLQSIAVTPVNTSLPTGETEQFTATGTLSDNTTENLTSQVTWASSDTTWATINATGLATAVSPGPVTISAAFDGITGSTGLTVTARGPPVDRGDPGQYQPAHRGNRAVHRHRHSVRQHHREPDQPGDLGFLRHHLGHDQHDRAGHGRVARPRDDLSGLRWHHRLDRADRWSTPAPTPTQTVVIGEQPLLVRKLNKKGKPIGKPVLSGFTLDLGVPLNAASASNAANYQVDTVTTKRVKKKIETILHPIKKFTVSYVAASNAIEIKLGATETFPTGGQLTVLGGLTTASGGTLSGPAVFTISKGGKSIGPS